MGAQKLSSGSPLQLLHKGNKAVGVVARPAQVLEPPPIGVVLGLATVGQLQGQLHPQVDQVILPHLQGTGNTAGQSVLAHLIDGVAAGNVTNFVGHHPG